MLSTTRHRAPHARSNRVRKAPVAALAAQRPVPRANGHDRALYTCSGGHAFLAVVSTSVRCPHCGEPQAW